MKILLVTSSDIHGGAARAANRLHKALLIQDINCHMLVQNKSSNEFTVIGPKGKINQFLAYISNTVDQFQLFNYKKKSITRFSPSWISLNNFAKEINKINPDIVHLHWINTGMIKIEDLAKIKAPIVWSLHDMWPFTGGCHYDEECGLYTNECKNCKVLNSLKDNDLSNKIFKRKAKAYAKIKNITIVGLSKWLHTSAKKSPLLKDKKHINLPNPIDVNIFKPFDKSNARKLWGLPLDKKLILFGAMGATSDPRKGFEELKKAIKELKHDNIELVVFGSNKPKYSQDFGFVTHYLGLLHDDISLVTLYSAVDIMVVPSIQENLSNAIMESLACGIPVIAFDIGGNGDMIKHKYNGYLSKPFDTYDLAYGIDWTLNNSNYSALCKNARKKIIQEFNSVDVAHKYIELYDNILK